MELFSLIIKLLFLAGVGYLIIELIRNQRRILANQIYLEELRKELLELQKEPPARRKTREEILFERYQPEAGCMDETDALALARQLPNLAFNQAGNKAIQTAITEPARVIPPWTLSREIYEELAAAIFQTVPLRWFDYRKRHQLLEADALEQSEQQT